MADPTPPPGRGQMRLYDAMVLPFAMGHHRLATRVDVAHEGRADVLASERHFEVDGPRWTLSPDEIAAVIPPRNGTGAFAETLPQIVLHRRTLPWERSLGAPASPGTPPAPGDPPPLSGDAPWLALLVLEEDEYTFLERIPLEQIVPDAAFTRLGRPAGVLCDAIEVSADVLSSVMPSREELALLTHVRRVNVEDRAAAGRDPDGWFAVVMANRLPPPGERAHAFLVSVEGRTDLVAATPPPSVEGTPVVPVRPSEDEPVVRDVLRRAAGPRRFDVASVFPFQQKRLVVLHHWRFEVTAGGTFRDRMQQLDVGLLGDLRDADGAPATDTGHIALELSDRQGARESVWYRGPLVAHPLTRDPLGPYHSADQARRVSPETGAEDISYAAAFEAGRLLAAADGRLAQELMRWRRASYDEAGRVRVLDAIRAELPLAGTLADTLARAVAATVGADVVARFAAAAPTADPSGLAALARAPGLDPAALAQAWRLPSPDAASAVLKGTRPGAPVAAADVVAPALDDAALAWLAEARRTLSTPAARPPGEPRPPRPQRPPRRNP